MINDKKAHFAHCYIFPDACKSSCGDREGLESFYHRFVEQASK